jgi:hypothetical protein
MLRIVIILFIIPFISSCKKDILKKDISGCTNSNAFNYNNIATLDDGSCSYTPPEQSTFTRSWENLESKYSSSNNTDAQESHWLSETKTHLDQKLPVEYWYGEVDDVGSNYITVKNDGIKYYLYPKEKGHDYLQYGKLMRLRFSGQLNGKYTWVCN